MILYSDEGGRAPSPRRVRVFAAERGVPLEVVRLALHEDNRTEAFRQKNPMGNLPVLELDDGTCLSETMAICRYLDATAPGRRLFGEGALEEATVEMWNRRAELAFYLPIEFAGGFLGEAAAEGARKQVARMLAFFDGELATRRYLAGDELTVADITAKIAIDFGVRFNAIEVPEDLRHFGRWSTALNAREAFSA